MKLYLVHCGFYDSEICQGLYESHVNFFVAASNPAAARLRAKELPEFRAKRMHVDGLQEIEAVDGYRLSLQLEAALGGATQITAIKHRDLAPQPTSTRAESL